MKQLSDTTPYYSLQRDIDKITHLKIVFQLHPMKVIEKMQKLFASLLKNYLMS